jgi:hypothetical protein
MSAYDEIATFSRAWVNRQNEAKLALEGVIKHFIKWCEIPSDRVQFLPWDDAKKVFTAKSSDLDSLSQACHFFNETNEWGVGLSIYLAPRGGMGSSAKVAFTVRVKADDANFTVTFGSLKPQKTNLASASWCDDFFAAAVESLKASFTTSNIKSQIGFNPSLSSDPQITT